MATVTPPAWHRGWEAQMTMARYAQRPKAELPDGVITLRWNDRFKRWEVTVSDRHGRLLGTGISGNRVGLLPEVGMGLARAVINELDRQLPF